MLISMNETNLYEVNTSIFCINYLKKIFAQLGPPLKKISGSAPEYISDIKVLESVQRHWIRVIEGLEEMSYADRLGHLDLFFLCRAGFSGRT